MSGARLSNAWLDWAILHGPQLSLAKFQNANFSATELSYADFTNAKHLGEEQLAESVGDASTILPVNILMPQTETWTDKVLPSETFFSPRRSVKKQAGLT